MENNYYTDEPINAANNYDNQNQTSTGMAIDNNPVMFENDSGLPMVFGLGLLFFIFVIAIAIYAYVAIALQKMARKINIQDDWFAWVPILNLVLILRIANRPIWWIVFLLIPIVQVIVSVIVWMDVAKAMGREEWWGILMVIPGVNLVVIGYLAFFSNTTLLQEINDVQGGPIPEDAILADTENTDFREGLGMENDAAGQWETQSLASDVSETQSNTKDVSGTQSKEEDLKKKDQE